jgi:hypothetical protein
MSDLPSPSFSDDDLSADLDGELDAETHARIAGDPVARARQAELAAAAAFVATPVSPLDADVADRLVTTAAATPRRRGRGPTPWLVAAAVILLVAVGMTLVWSGRDTGSDEASSQRTAADAAEPETELDATEGTEAPPTTLSPDAAAGALDGATPERGTSSESVTSGAPSTAPFLGSFDDADELRTAFATTLAPADEAEPPADVEVPFDEAFTRCAEQLAFTLDLDGDPLASGYAVVDGMLVLVYEWDHESFEDGRPTTLVTAVGRDACDEVALFER